MDGTSEKEERVKVKCHVCGYVWLSRSKKRYVSCPDCRRGTLRDKDSLRFDSPKPASE